MKTGPCGHQRQPGKTLKCLVLYAVALLSACTPNFSNLIVAEPEMVQDCRYLGTISDFSDPGKSIFPNKYGRYYDGERKVLERAYHLGATHIVWQYNYAIGSSASAYQCPE